MKAFRSADEAVFHMARTAVATGREVSPRGMGTFDLLGDAFVVAEPRNRVTRCRPIREGYAAASVAWNLGCRYDVESICRWNPNGRVISDDGETFHGADYGRRWDGHLQAAMELLSRDRDTRRAWVPIWDHQTEYDVMAGSPGYSAEGKDVPCTIGFGLRLVGGKLVMQVVMRSQSLWGVMPYDIYLFTVLQELIANQFGVELGHYEHLMLSAHVYERELEHIKEVLERGSPPAQPMEPIKLDLHGASREYVDVFDTLTAGAGLAVANDDPVIAMMESQAPDIQREVPA